MTPPLFSRRARLVAKKLGSYYRESARLTAPLLRSDSSAGNFGCGISQPLSMTIKERLKQLRPDVEIKSVKVVVSEVCMEDHPPSHKTWVYTEGSDAGEKLGQLYHDRTTMQTGGFDPLIPILACINRKILSHSGKLFNYYNDDGHTVSCSYTADVSYVIKEDTAEERMNGGSDGQSINPEAPT